MALSLGFLDGFQMSWLGIPIAFGAVWLAKGICVAIYRLHFSPLSKFPGPKLAAVTGWYEAYFDLIHHGGGRFPFEIARMHSLYGPIVRINPDELHVADAEFYDVLYPTGTPYDKPAKFENRLGVPYSLIGTSSGPLHRTRRAAVSPLFAKARVRDEYSGRVQAAIDRISLRLEKEWKGRGEEAVLRIDDTFKCFTADIIMDLMFTQPKNFWKAPDFRVGFLQAVDGLARWAHVTFHFPLINQLLNSLPDWFIETVFPPFRPLIELRRETKQLIAKILEEKARFDAFASYQSTKSKKTATMGDSPQHENLFREMVFSGILPPSEVHLERLAQEGSFLVGAGFEAAAWTLSVGSFYVVDLPSVHNRLKAELMEAIPDPAVIPPWQQLEQLPYLTAVIKESLRLSNSKVARLPRQQNSLTLKTGRPWVYGDWGVIPDGAIVGMDLWTLHTDKAVWGPNAAEFRPERWLDDPKGPDGVKPLTRYLLAFSKGTRGCAGLHLAYCELYIGLATLFRRHNFSLYGTSKADVGFEQEFLKSVPWSGSKGVRFLVN